MPTQFARTCAVAAAALIGVLSVAEAAQVFESGERQVGLLELYTSEGCSSCPPADRWLSGLEASPGLWRDFVPVAFHVDYWDELGWSDRFARPAYSERQRRQAAAGAVSTVYTPGLIWAGAEYRRWGRQAPAALDRRVGRLRAELDGGRLRILFAPVAARNAPLRVQAVRLGADLVTHVRAGENTDRRLRHDFVALAMVEAELAARDGRYEATMAMPVGDSSAPREALAVWVTRANTLPALQATGGWLRP